MTNLTKFIKRKTERRLKRIVKSVFKNHAYVAKHGLAKGFKITGDLGFLTKPSFTYESRFFMSLDLAGKTVYDVGSHIGLITLFFSKAVGETGKVVSFEPNPETFAILHKNVEMNGLTNVKLVNIGLGEKRDTLVLVYGEYNGAQGTLDKARQEWLIKTRQGVKWKAASIEVYPLDEYILLALLPDPDFVKIDVEGHEYSVLLGMQDTIRRCKPALLVEIHGIAKEQKLENARKIVKLLVSQAYEIQDAISRQVISESNIALILRPPFPLFCK